MRHLLALLSLVSFWHLIEARAADRNEYTSEELHLHFQNEAEGYEFTADGNKFELRKQPLIHWQNTVRLQELGATYVWESNGIPKVLVSIFTYEMSGKVYRRHEAVSLSDKPFACTLHSREVWTPQEAGLRWKTLVDAGEPSDSVSRRLFQMRTIARQFSGNLDHTKHPSRLELIPQPMIRYSGPDEGIVDGAIFRLVVATDPEILLVVEAHQTKNGTRQFRYSAVRSNYHALRLSLKGETVWNEPLILELETTRAGQRPWANQNYFIFTPSEPLPQPGAIK